jgi:hypothetical protein
MKGKGSLRSQPNPSVQPELTASAHFKRDIRAVLDLRTFADLHERLRSKCYRHQALRRGHVPKGKGQWRPIGISAFEDKIVQDAVREVMAAVCEQDFLDCSYGFRPKRSAHDAIRALDRAVHRGKVSWILEADIASFFDSLDRTKLKEMLQVRIADGSLLRLIGKCLHVGVLDGAEYSEPERGTTQGSVLSPLLGGVNGNIRSLTLLVHVTRQCWFKWLRRRSQRTRLNWERFERMLERYPLPQPRITIRIWGGNP